MHRHGEWPQTRVNLTDEEFWRRHAAEKAAREAEAARLVAMAPTTGARLPAPTGRPPLRHDPGDPECVCEGCDPEPIAEPLRRRLVLSAASPASAS
jgi:hypothetical protein